MFYLLYLSIVATFLCVAVAVLSALKYISISKMRIDDGDQKKKLRMSTVETLTLLKNLKPFPVSIHKGWKLHSFQNCSRVWHQEISVNSSNASHNIYAAFNKIRVSPQLILQILKDVSKTSSWKPGCLATSITFNPPDIETGSRIKGTMGSLPVQHDIVMEETSVNLPEPTGGIWHYILALFGQNGTTQSLTKELRRYWHREDNGVCWHLQMCEYHQQWLYFLAQPVEEVDECLLTVVGCYDNDPTTTTPAYISEVMGSLSQYIIYRKLTHTALIDIKLPSAKQTDKTSRSYSSSDDTAYDQSTGKPMLLRFRSVIEKPSFGADKFYSAKREILRSSNILHHHNRPVTPDSSPHKTTNKSLKTSSLDRKKDMPKLDTYKESNLESSKEDTEESERSSPVNVREAENKLTELDEHKVENNNLVKSESSDTQIPHVSLEGNSEVNTTEETRVGVASDTRNTAEKDLDKILDEDISDQERYEKANGEIAGSKEDIQHIVAANHTAAELLHVALQASNLDLSKSIEEQVTNSGGWMFCGLDNDVVVLKKISVRENVQCYLGKGVIQASPKTVWNAIKNPRTRFTYDDSLKKVDVLETVTESIKIVYYYHEVLQLFKTECCDMVLIQSERIDRGDRYVLAMQSSDREGVVCPEGTSRVKVLPSGWIIEPMSKDKKVHSMVTYIMQIDFGTMRTGLDKTAFEDLISKQPMSIAYLRQYLRGCAYLK